MIKNIGDLWEKPLPLQTKKVLYKNLLKPLLFRLDAEKAHHLTFSMAQGFITIPGSKSLLSACFSPPKKMEPVQAFGLTFPNCIGLAAGFDKDGKLIEALECLGFGFVEIGTLTPRPQAGNPKPRLFRLPKDRALINRMGFNNQGVDAAVKRLQKVKRGKMILGGNIGKNKDTPNEQALDDYLYCLEALYPYVDYFVVNLSSPNTPNLRALQDKEPLEKLLSGLAEARKQKDIYRPILLKIAPDLSEGQLDDILAITQSTGMNGIIATNTTIGREAPSYTAEYLDTIGSGGLSGAPLREKSLSIVEKIKVKSQGKMPVIGVGGISNGDEAKNMLAHGASLVQLYSALVYEGPSLPKRILHQLSS